MGRSTLTVLVYLGCLKAGLAYMPLERTLPRDRIRFMVEEARCKMVLTSSPCPISDFVNCVDLVKFSYITEETQITTAQPVSASQLCSVMFTSGSTGLPKGVMVEHRGMVNLCDPTTSNWQGRMRTGWTTGVAFDPSGFQIFSTLASGSELHILPDDGVFRSDRYIDFLIHSGTPCSLSKEVLKYSFALPGVERIYLTPSILSVLLQEGPEWLQKTSLRSLMVGGEIPDPSKLHMCRIKLPSLEIIQSYGPTEGSVRSCFFVVPAYFDLQRTVRLPLGNPLPNVSVLIIDPISFLPVPPGVQGEIAIAGVNVTRGYLNRPELTREKFIVLPADNPFGQLQVYRAGDIGFRDKDGLVHFVGRNDGQIKIRGQRLELGEIEQVLSQHPSVQACVVAAVPSGTSHQLVAYYTERVMTRLSTSGVEELSAYLRQILPIFMVPNRFLKVDALPLTITGKLDRRLMSSHNYLNSLEIEPSDLAMVEMCVFVDSFTSQGDILI